MLFGAERDLNVYVAGTEGRPASRSDSAIDGDKIVHDNKSHQNKETLMIYWLILKTKTIL